MTHSRPLPVITAALLVLSSSMASAQLGGFWTISVTSCCADPEEPGCETATLNIAVAQNGNQLSGWSLQSGDIPPECGNVTCTPATPGCDEALELAGTVSDNSVEVIFTQQQSLRASCVVMGISCLLELNFAGGVQAHGTLTGQTIDGTFESQGTASCQLTGDPRCEAAGVECSVAPCTGNFTAAVSPLCMGDCIGDAQVTVDEVLAMVNIALGNLHIAACGAGDGNGDDQITVDEILAAVNYALSGCA